MKRIWNDSWMLLVTALEEMDIVYVCRHGEVMQVTNMEGMYICKEPVIEAMVGDSFITFKRGEADE